MKALALDGIGGLEHLALHDLPRPEIVDPGDALVRVYAAALNRLDLFVADGLPGVEYRFPHIVGSDLQTYSRRRRRLDIRTAYERMPGH